MSDKIHCVESSVWAYFQQKNELLLVLSISLFWDRSHCSWAPAQPRNCRTVVCHRLSPGSFLFLEMNYKNNCLLSCYSWFSRIARKVVGECWAADRSSNLIFLNTCALSEGWYFLLKQSALVALHILWLSPAHFSPGFQGWTVGYLLFPVSQKQGRDCTCYFCFVKIGFLGVVLAV